MNGILFSSLLFFLFKVSKSTGASQNQKFKYVLFYRNQSLELQFVSGIDIPVEWHVMLHNKNDLPDALTIHPGFHIKDQEKEYHLRNKHFSKPSTRSLPCSKHHPKTCRDILLSKKIASKYNCQVPVFFTGKHLDDFKNLPKCNMSVTKDMLLSPLQNTCSQSVPCEHTDYSIDGAFPLESVDDCSYSRFRLTYRQLVQEHYKSYIAVGKQTLIGKVGGILGITVGWSGITLLEMCFESLFNIISFL